MRQNPPLVCAMSHVPRRQIRDLAEGAEASASRAEGAQTSHEDGTRRPGTCGRPVPCGSLSAGKPRLDLDDSVLHPIGDGQAVFTACGEQEGERRVQDLDLVRESREEG